MRTLLGIASVLAVALAIYWATAEETTIQYADGVPRDIPPNQLMVWQQKIECQPADEPPEMSIEIWVDPTDGKNRIYFDLTEAHGYYVDTCNLTFWYAGAEDGAGWRDSPLVVGHVLNNFVEAHSRLRSCIDIPWAELQKVGGHMGRTEHWRASVEACYRACVGNPERLPNVITAVSCG